MEFADAMQVRSKALSDPSRFRIVRHIAESSEPVGIAELTELLGFNHNAIRQHLSVLVEAGVVTEADEQRSTRGRPRKLYQLREDALDPFAAVTGSYERLARLLLEVVVSGDSPYEVGRRAGLADNAPAAAEEGEVATLLQGLAVQGFDPVEAELGVITLQRCPFAEVATKDQAVICDLHRGLIDGQLAATTAGAPSEPTVQLTVGDPQTAGCLVSIINSDS